MDVPFPISVVGQETVLSPLPDEAQTPGARWGGWGAGDMGCGGVSRANLCWA